MALSGDDCSGAHQRNPGARARLPVVAPAATTTPLLLRDRRLGAEASGRAQPASVAARGSWEQKQAVRAWCSPSARIWVIAEGGSPLVAVCDRGRVTVVGTFDGDELPLRFRDDRPTVLPMLPWALFAPTRDHDARHNVSLACDSAAPRATRSNPVRAREGRLQGRVARSNTGKHRLAWLSIGGEVGVLPHRSIAVPLVVRCTWASWPWFAIEVEVLAFGVVRGVGCTRG
jgi:hypothetical protein